MKQFPNFGCSTPKFIYFHEVPHLLIEVHLVPLLAVHLGLQDIFWLLNVVSRSQIKLFTKFGSSSLKFIHFHEVHDLLVEVHLVPLLAVHLGVQDIIID